jgi:hypothetical protein
MARGDDWSDVENEAIVAVYFEMLVLERRGEPYEKLERNQALAQRLDGRSLKAIEYKHANITAALHSLDWPGIDGYKPRHNYQASLRDAVADRMLRDGALRALLELEVAAPLDPKLISGTMLAEESAPRAEQPGMYVGEPARASKQRPRIGIDYLAREARNASLGLAGELLVVAHEKARLLKAGLDALAEKVEHVSLTEGDGVGFDIRSFGIDRRDRLIEVKTTAYGRDTPFYVSRNEVATSSELADSYHLYRVFHARAAPRFYTVPGALSHSFRLVPELFSARVA